MGNRDLDGDVYWVCWDKDLFQKVEAIAHEEIDEPKVKKAESGSILKDICFLLSNNNLG